jgi:hypothetical protein
MFQKLLNPSGSIRPEEDEGGGDRINRETGIEQKPGNKKIRNSGMILKPFIVMAVLLLSSGKTGKPIF